MDIAEALHLLEGSAVAQERLLGFHNLRGVDLGEVGHEVGAHAIKVLALAEAAEVAFQLLGAGGFFGYYGISGVSGDSG